MPCSFVRRRSATHSFPYVTHTPLIGLLVSESTTTKMKRSSVEKRGGSDPTPVPVPVPADGLAVDGGAGVAGVGTAVGWTITTGTAVALVRPLPPPVSALGAADGCAPG